MKTMMRLMVVGAAGLLAGCAVDSTGSGSGQAHTSSSSGSTFADDVASGDPSLPGYKQGQEVGSVDDAGFRDYAAVAYHDWEGREHVRQWLVEETGQNYFTRECLVAPSGGATWGTCSAWEDHQIADMGLPTFVPVASMEAFVYQLDGQEWIAQSVINQVGTQRMGRVCRVGDKSIDFSQCSDWSKLQENFADLAVRSSGTFRDEITIQFTNDDGILTYSNSMIGMDGAYRFERNCQTESGQPIMGKCVFGHQRETRDYGIPLDTITGHGGFIYHDNDEAWYQETVFASGTDAGTRSCPISTRGIEWEACGSWSDVTIRGITKRVGGAL